MSTDLPTELFRNSMQFCLTDRYLHEIGGNISHASAILSHKRLQPSTNVLFLFHAVSLSVHMAETARLHSP